MIVRALKRTGHVLVSIATVFVSVAAIPVMLMSHLFIPAVAFTLYYVGFAIVGGLAMGTLHLIGAVSSHTPLSNAGLSLVGVAVVVTALTIGAHLDDWAVARRLARFS